MSGSHKISSNIVISEFYELVSDVKDEIVISDDKYEIAFGGQQEQPEQQELDSNSELEVDKFNRDTLNIEIPSIDDEIDIKYEKHNWALNGENDLDVGHDDELPRMNAKPAQDAAKDSEQIELNQFYADLLQCERDCETCQMYIRKLMEHVRCTHTLVHQPSDPLHIDPPEMGLSSFIEIKCEEDKDIGKMDCSEVIESDPDFDGECDCDSDSDSDPDYSASPHFTRNPTRRSVVKGTETEMEFPNEGTSKLRAKVQTGDKQFTCKTCGEGFVSKYKLTKHEWTHTGEAPHTCETCGKFFTKRSHLISHMRSHTGERPFNCTVCGKCFSYKSKLEVHKICHTGVKPFKCEQCAKDFIRKDRLNEHLKTHTGSMTFKCDECEESFSRRWDLERHRTSHSREKSIDCTMCGKCFSLKCNLEVHMVSHTGVKVFKCEQCAKSFKGKNKLTENMRSHTGEQSFNCETCSKSFGRKSELTVHMRYHTGEASLKCYECEVGFTKSSNLSRHKRSIHNMCNKFRIDSAH